MNMTIYFGGCKNEDSVYYSELEDLLRFLTIPLARVPNKGETLTLFLGDFHLDMEVADVYTHYCVPGNSHIKESGWGEEYAIYVKNVEVIECFRKKEE